MAEAFGCSESGIRDALRRHKVAAYQEEIKDIPLEKIAYVDESISAVALSLLR